MSVSWDRVSFKRKLHYQANIFLELEFSDVPKVFGRPWRLYITSRLKILTSSANSKSPSNLRFLFPWAWAQKKKTTMRQRESFISPPTELDGLTSSSGVGRMSRGMCRQGAPPRRRKSIRSSSSPTILSPPLFLSPLYPAPVFRKNYRISTSNILE